jgi:hypothetical protein
MIRSWFAIAALVVVSLLGDFLCRTQARSQDGEKLMKAGVSRVEQLPERIGSWHVASSEPLEENVVRVLRCRAHQNRTYVDDETGEEVSLILLLGSAGPLLAHTPEVCYSSVDYETIEPAHPEIIRGTGDRADIFNQVTVRAQTVTGETQHILYAWRKAQGVWQAPQNPRLTLGGQPMLYKLQLVTMSVSAGPDQPASDPGRRFLGELLPVLEKSLNIP